MSDRPQASDPPNPRPCLAELFRTCVYPPSLHLRIEKILVVEACNYDQRNESLGDDRLSADQRRKSVHRLFLSDGVLVVQALLGCRLSSLTGAEDMVVGDMVVLNKFRIKRAKRANGAGEVVFLGIGDCHIVRSKSSERQAETRKRSAIEYLGENQEREAMPNKKAKVIASSAEPSSELQHTRKRRAESIKSTQESDSDDFETTSFDHRKLDSKRKALHLHELNANGSFDSQNSITPTNGTIPVLHKKRPPATIDLSQDHLSTRQTAKQPDSRPTPSLSPNTLQTKQQPHRQGTTATTHIAPALQSPPPPPPAPSKPLRQTEPPYHTLSSLLLSPLPKSYSCTLFALISWISPHTLRPAPHSPFPPKRHVKIHDPSIAHRHAGVTVAVYCDAEHFRPALGSVALWRGVVMQRTGTGDVVLNAYERLMREPGVAGVGGRWFEDDEAVLRRLGWDVGGLRGWWEGRVREREERRTRGR